MNPPPPRSKPVAPIAGYKGGKRFLARRICALIDATPHDGYAEPFVGMGGIFLRRSTRPRVEVINDISGDVVNLFRVLQEHYRYFIDMLRFRVSARAEFDRLNAIAPEHLTDLQRAARFFYLQRTAWGGRIVGRSFGVSKRDPSNFNVRSLEPMLAAVADRLARVTIEQLAFDAFLARYDRPGMLFYLDPPYFGCETDYGPGVFGRADFARLAQLLGAGRAQFILSINDTPEIRATFADFYMRAIDTTWSIGTLSADDMRRGELLISNRPLPDCGF